MRPRFVGRLGLADGVSAVNAALGFVAVAVLPGDPELAARLVLLAAIADGLDGVVARWRGGTPVGEYIDSLADVASFGVAPAGIAAAVAAEQLRGSSLPLFGDRLAGIDDPVLTALVFGLPALYVTMAVVRLAFYTAYDVENHHTIGVQSTLGGTLVAVGVLAGVPAWAVLAATGLFAYLMVAEIEYPDLRRRHAVVMGAVQAGAVLAPDAFGGLFPVALLAWALAYLLFGPWLYWRVAARDRPTRDAADSTTR